MTSPLYERCISKGKMLLIDTNATKFAFGVMVNMLSGT